MNIRFHSLILAVLIILVFIVWTLLGPHPLKVTPPNREASKRQPVTPLSSQNIITSGLSAELDERDRFRLQVKGEKMVLDARKALEAGDKRGFEGWMSEIIYRYEGDPNPLVLQFFDVLRHDDPQLRIRMSGYFLLTNLKADEPIGVLRDLVQSDKPLSYGPEKNEFLNEESPPSDYRFRAAEMLALYRIEESRDDLWELYKKTSERELIKSLRRLNDRRIIEEVKEETLMKMMSIENMELIGEFQISEALPELKKRYEDKALKFDLHFRTLYPLWRITGEEKYFDEFIEAFFPAKVPVPYLVFGGRKEKDYLVRMLKTERSDTLVKAAMALHLRFKDDKPLIEMLLGYFQDARSSNWEDGNLARRLVGSIGDPELNRVAEEYEAKYKTGFHQRLAVYRKNWRYPEWEAALFLR